MFGLPEIHDPIMPENPISKPYKHLTANQEAFSEPVVSLSLPETEIMIKK
jgi:hypothetical protein